MTQSEFLALAQECKELLSKRAPYDTGNLSKESIKLEVIGNTARLYVEEGSGGTLSRPPEGWHGIAPYMKYTNEKWKHGKNPNEGWFDRAAAEIAALVAERVNGTPKGELKDD